MNPKKAESLQVLVATMNNNGESLLQSLNIQSDVIIGNQCTQINPQDYHYQNEYKNHKITWLNFKEKGVGLNRNNALMRSTADILLFSDDDMTYVDNYPHIVLDLFNSHPKADLIVFNLIEDTPKRYQIKKMEYTKKVGFGCARIACRRESIIKHGVFFNLCFGGGAIYSNGEDSLFIADCLRKGLKLLCVPISIAKLNNDRPSTWYKGETDKLYYDRGSLFAAFRLRYTYIRLMYKFICAVFHGRNELRKWRLFFNGFLEFRRDNKLNIYKED